jgi:hypothetical protein
VLAMLQGTLGHKLSRHARTCGDTGIDSADASGNGRECVCGCKEALSMTDPVLLCGEGSRPRRCMTASAGQWTEPRAPGDEHLRCPRKAAMDVCGVLEQTVPTGDGHLAGWHTACGVDQTVAEPVFGDDPACERRMLSQPPVLNRAEPGLLCGGHAPCERFRKTTEPASLGVKILGAALWLSRPTCSLVSFMPSAQDSRASPFGSMGESTGVAITGQQRLDSRD